MFDYIKKLKSLGVKLPTILIPRETDNLKNWAVVACDQYTSDMEYWQSVEKIVQGKPSTLNLIYPECYLEEADSEQRISNINKTMQKYIDEGIFKEYEQTMFLVYRETRPGFGRWGLIVALDLDQYDYSVGSKSLIRATEGTIIDRIPPRKRIRKNAPLEFPHILVLIEDEKRSIIEPLADKKDTLEQIYSFDLMKDSGSIEAYAVNRPEDVQQVADALERLADIKDFSRRHNSDDLLLYAMGDGNHSLATAKSCWEDIKKGLSPDDQKENPARYALVEIENIYDKGLVFEPIHRVIFNGNKDAILKELLNNCDSYRLSEVDTLENMVEQINIQDDNQYFGLVDDQKQLYVVCIKNPSAHIVAGTLQSTLDAYIHNTNTVSIDYTHGTLVTYNLGIISGNVGIFLPRIPKNDFFSSIIHDGTLPRKTFSMGEDYEKRFYIEGRRIK